MFGRLITDFFYATGAPPSSMPWHVEPPTRVMQAALTERSGRPALDVGCGTGAHAVYLVQQGFHVTGIDVSAEALPHAEHAANEAGVVVDWQLGDALTWAPERKFDFVFDRGLMHCLPSQVLGLYKRQLFSWLRPGGQFVLVHVQREHWLDICPLGPSKLSGSQLRNHLAPQFSEIECMDEGQMRPLGVGPLLRTRGYRFRAQPTETSGHVPLTRGLILPVG